MKIMFRINLDLFKKFGHNELYTGQVGGISIGLGYVCVSPIRLETFEIWQRNFMNRFKTYDFFDYPELIKKIGNYTFD